MIGFTFNSNRAESGSITGLNDSEWGQIGVNNMQGTFGCTWIPDTKIHLSHTGKLAHTCDMTVGNNKQEKANQVWLKADLGTVRDTHAVRTEILFDFP